VASGEDVGEEAGRNELGVDLEEVARLSCLGWCSGFRHTVPAWTVERVWRSRGVGPAYIQPPLSAVP
jgi:hypothetical protein